MENKVFINNLKFLREQRKLSYRTLSSNLGVSKSTIQRIETGHTQCSQELIEKIALFFQVPLEILKEIELEAFEYREVLCRMYITKSQYHHLCMKVMSGKVQDRQDVLIQIINLITTADGQFHFKENILEYYPNPDVIQGMSGSLIQISGTASEKTITQLLAQRDEEIEVVQEVVTAINQAFDIRKEKHRLWKSTFIRKYIFREETRKIQKELSLNNWMYYAVVENASILICNQLNLYSYITVDM